MALGTCLAFSACEWIASEQCSHAVAFSSGHLLQILAARCLPHMRQLMPAAIAGARQNDEGQLKR